MTLEELETLVQGLLTLINSLSSAITNCATTDDLSALANTINELQKNNTLMQDEMAALKTSVDKVDHLQKLNDVSLNEDDAKLTEGDLLQYGNDGKWHNINIKNIKFDIPAAPKNLSDLSDVVFSNITNESHLVYSTALGKWTNSLLPDDSDETDLSNYLTKTEAAKIYFPFAGGTIIGPTVIKSYLHTTGNITSEAAITAKQSAI